jgi:hypothetical protein
VGVLASRGQVAWRDLCRGAARSAALRGGPASHRTQPRSSRPEVSRVEDDLARIISRAITHGDLHRTGGRPGGSHAPFGAKLIFSGRTEQRDCCTGFTSPLALSGSKYIG